MGAATWLRGLPARLKAVLRETPSVAPDAKGPPATAPAEPSASNPYQPAADRIRATATWLVGALAAVATVMLAGSQLSTIGALSPSEDASRFALAVGAAIVAVGAVAFAVSRLSIVQAPAEMGLGALARTAGDARSELTTMAAADIGLRGGRESLSEFVRDYENLRRSEYDAEDALETAKAASARATSRKARKEAAERVAAAQAAVAGAHAKVVDLRPRIVDLVRLAAYFELRGRWRRERRWVLVAALVVAGAIVCFAWAANPDAPPEEASSAVAQSPASGVVVLNADGMESLETVMGEECAAAAGQETGVPVIVLASEDSSYDLVLVPSSSCPDPIRVTIRSVDGRVLGAEAEVSPLSGPGSSGR